MGMAIVTNDAFAAAKKAPAKSAKATVGQVVSFNDMLKGGDGLVKKDKALEKAEKGEIICLKVGKKVYFIMNEDGTIASKKLAGYANNAKVGVKGTMSTKNGFNIIIATAIENM